MVQASEAKVEAAVDVEDEAAGGDRPMEPSGAPTASEIRMTPKNCWSRSHDNDDDNGNGGGDPPKCWFCGESGHLQQNCAVREKGREAEREFKRRKHTANDGADPKTESANLTIGTKPAGPGF